MTVLPLRIYTVFKHFAYQAWKRRKFAIEVRLKRLNVDSPFKNTHYISPNNSYLYNKGINCYILYKWEVYSHARSDYPTNKESALYTSCTRNF